MRNVIKIAHVPVKEIIAIFILTFEHLFIFITIVLQHHDIKISFQHISCWFDPNVLVPGQMALYLSLL